MNKILFVAISVLIISCHSKTDNKLRNMAIPETILSGQILDFNDTMPKTISVLIFDIASAKQKSDVQEIDSLGKFRFNLDLYYPEDFFIEYNDQGSELLLKPGDSLFISFYTKDINKTMKFIGNQAILNQQVKEFLAIFFEYWDKNGDVVRKLKGKSIAEYKALVSQQQEKYDSILNKFVINENPTKETETWIRNYLKYRCGINLLHWFTDPDNIALEEQFDFNSKYPVEYSDEFVSSEWRLYMSQYNSIYFFRTGKLKNALDFYLKGDYYNYLKLFTDSINTHYSGFTRDVLLAQTYFGMIQRDYKTVDSVLKSSTFKINSEIILKRVKNEIESIRLIANSPKVGINLNRDPQLTNGQFLKNLINDKFTGKVVYVDFWATWCSPCMTELPYSRLLHKKFENQDIEFIYICCDSEKNKWEKTVTEYGLKGEHLFLEKEKYSFLRAKYQISGFPTYMIFDKTGQLVDNNAPRPNTKEIEIILKQLIQK